MPAKHRVQPPLLRANRLVSTSTDLGVECGELGSSLLPTCPPHVHRLAGSAPSHDVRETEEVERLGPSPAVTFASLERKAPESDHTRLLGMQRKPEPSESRVPALPA